MPAKDKDLAKILQGKIIQARREAEERDAQRRAAKNSLEYIDLSTAPINVEALDLISEETAKKAKAAPIEIKEQRLAIVVFDPELSETKALIENLKAKEYQLKIFVTSLSHLEYAWGFYKFAVKKTEEITGRVRIDEKRLNELKAGLTTLDGVKNALDLLGQASGQTAQILEILLAGAMANRASDIHLEPTKQAVHLRLRIDGILHDVFGNFKHNIYLYLLSRIKLLSSLKINIHDEAQDGRFTIKFPDKEVEVRVAIAPSEFGEVAVMRLLDPGTISLDLKELGLRDDDLEIIEKELKRPNGLMLNTGPTGSGKTTTLYAFLKHKKSPEIKIITIEDPIEYHLEGIEQTQVDDEAGYTFANGLRSLMRQDPDVILVGEIRDKETGEIGVQAALTGHLVFSTLHTNAAAGAIPRLLDLGVKASSIGPALNLVIAQRLVRRLCLECKKETPLENKFLTGQETDLKTRVQKFLEKLPKRVDKNAFKEIKIFEPTGCPKCNNTGYKGRIAIYELLLVGPEMEELISAQAGEPKIQKFALAQGMATMQQDGILKVISGITTFEEVEGITGPLEF
jgi:type IV pilus assembly protein PilB